MFKTVRPIDLSLLVLWAVSAIAAAQGTALSPAAASAPPGATGICSNGAYTYSQERKGSCRGRQGLQEWFGPRPDRAPTSRSEPALPVAAQVVAAPIANADEATKPPSAPPPVAAPISTADEAMKRALLNEGGFNVDWTCEYSRGGSKVGFREDGQKLIVDIDNLSRGSCKSEARMTNAGVAWNGCSGGNIVMTYQPGNRDVPFTGKGSQCVYVFKKK